MRLELGVQQPARVGVELAVQVRVAAERRGDVAVDLGQDRQLRLGVGRVVEARQRRHVAVAELGFQERRELREPIQGRDDREAVEAPLRRVEVVARRPVEVQHGLGAVGPVPRALLRVVAVGHVDVVCLAAAELEAHAVVGQRPRRPRADRRLRRPRLGEDLGDGRRAADVVAELPVDVLLHARGVALGAAGDGVERVAHDADEGEAREGERRGQARVDLEEAHAEVGRVVRRGLGQPVPAPRPLRVPRHAVLRVLVPPAVHAAEGVRRDARAAVDGDVAEDPAVELRLRRHEVDRAVAVAHVALDELLLEAPGVEVAHVDGPGEEPAARDDGQPRHRVWMHVQPKFIEAASHEAPCMLPIVLPRRTCWRCGPSRIALSV